MTILGTALPAANTLATLYTVPAGRRSVANVSICNRGPGTAKIRLAISLTATPANSEYVEFDAQLAAAEVLERTAFSLAAGQKIVVQTDTATIAFNTWGIEEVA